MQAFDTLGTIGSNLLRSQRLIDVLSGAGEKMSKAEINEALAAINRLILLVSSTLHVSNSVLSYFFQGDSKCGPVAAGAQRRIL